MNPHQVFDWKKNLLFRMRYDVLRERQRREWPRDWWIPTKEVERATVAFLEEPLNIEEALTCENSKEWECAM